MFLVKHKTVVSSSCF